MKFLVPDNRSVAGRGAEMDRIEAERRPRIFLGNIPNRRWL
jgi:hypothetical protein